MALNYKSSLVRYRRYLQVAGQKPLWKATLFLSLSLILVVVLLIVAIKPTATKIAELEGKIKQQSKLSDQLNQKIVDDQKAARQLEQNRPRLTILTDGLPTTAEWKDWEQNMEGLATQSGVELNSVSIGTTVVKGQEIAPATGKKTIEVVTLPNEVSGINVSVEATGQYSQLRQFTEAVEKTRRIIIFSLTEIDKQKDGTLQLTLVGRIGYIDKFDNI